MIFVIILALYTKFDKNSVLPLLQLLGLYLEFYQYCQPLIIVILTENETFLVIIIF